MIVLDTNVISELARPAPLCQVSVWLAQQPTDGVYVTSVTEAELRYGLAITTASIVYLEMYSSATSCRSTMTPLRITPH
jgi:predicted nucleic acid-binding protein